MISCLWSRSIDANSPLSSWMLLVVLRAYRRRSNELAPMLTSLPGVIALVMFLSLPISTPGAVGSGMLVSLSKSNSRARGAYLLGDSAGGDNSVCGRCAAMMLLIVTGVLWEGHCIMCSPGALGGSGMLLGQSSSRVLNSD